MIWFLLYVVMLVGTCIYSHRLYLLDEDDPDWSASVAMGVLWPLALPYIMYLRFKDREEIRALKAKRFRDRELRRMQQPWDDARKALRERQEHNNKMRLEWEWEFYAAGGHRPSPRKFENRAIDLRRVRSGVEALDRYLRYNPRRQGIDTP